MSTWLDNPTGANKLRQSFLKGFLDVSGGGILVRADNSLNFYTTAGYGGNAAVSSFAIDANNIKVVDASSGDLVSFPTNKLSYIQDLSENVKSALADIRSYLTGNSKSSNTDTEKLNVDTDAKIGGNLNVGGNAYFDQNVDISGNLNIAQNLVTKGNGYFGGNLEVAGNQIINMNLYVKGDTFLNGRVFVTQDASFHSNIACYGEITSAGTISTAVDLSANGALKVAGTSNLAGAATLGNTLSVAGAATLSSTLGVTGAVTMSNTLGVTGAVTMSNTLGVTGAIQGSSTLAISSTSTFGAKATISAGGLEVTGATQLNNALTAIGAVDMSNSLTVAGASTFNDNITLNSAKTFTCGDLYIQNDKIAATNNDLVIDVSGGKKVHITGDLTVDGSFNFLGSVSQTNININVTDELFIESNGLNATMVAVQSNSTTDIAKFHYDASSSTPVMVVGAGNAVAINKGSATNGYSFDVSGQSQFSGKMALLHDLSLNGAAVINGTTQMKSLVTASNGLTVSSGNVGVTTGNVTVSAGDVTVGTGKLIVSTGDTEIKALKVASTSEFTGVATFNAGIVLGSTYIDQW
jgi:hypothetical protein